MDLHFLKDVFKKILSVQKWPLGTIRVVRIFLAKIENFDFQKYFLRTSRALNSYFV